VWVDQNGELDEVPVGIPELVVQVAARHWGNPGGLESEATGPLQARYGALTLTDAERAAVQRALGRPTGGLSTLTIDRGCYETGTVWVPTLPAPGPLFPFLDVCDL
jgi:hypothetical protein